MILLSNNQRKMHGLPLWRKKDKRKRYFTRCEALETIGAFLDYCNNCKQKGGNTVLKDTYIRIRLTAEQKEQIKEAAKRRKTNMSDFVLTATRNTIEKETK